MIGAALVLSTGRARKSVSLADYLDAEAEERAQRDAIAWIKALRHAEVDGASFRRRFTHRGDSLWWFTELYLHKQQVVLALFRAIHALGELVAREAPEAIEGQRCDRYAATILAGTDRVYRIPARAVMPGGPPIAARLAALHARARWLHLTALASRARLAPPATPRRGGIAAFVHRAFWRASAPRDEAGASTSSPVPAGTTETYVGPVLEALERQTGESLTYVTLGPAENFSARRWWHALKPLRAGGAAGIEAFAPLGALEASRTLWSARSRHLRAMGRSEALRAAAVIHGFDCWDIVREQLAGVALLQWPWSARAMDEAAAVLDAIEPAAALTYAEAGGWGRALVLECRRRSIPSAGLQHGFIYRHWLNYVHERDEMLPEEGNPADRGFPRPDTTLLFDDYARAHLIAAGSFPADALEVTGSPRLDALVRAAAALTDADIDAARALAGARSSALVLIVTKFREARSALAALLDAALPMDGVRLAIKTHPAETPDVYAPVVAGRPVTVLPASAPLAALVRASRAVVTVNSTVALDAAVLDVPALVVGLPNNLSPFVKAGVLAGAFSAEEAAVALRRILYDEEFRLLLESNRKAFLSRYRIGADGGAAERTAAAVLALARRPV